MDKKANNYLFLKMNKVCKTSHWYTCSSWNKNIWRKESVQGCTTGFFIFSFPSISRPREHCLRDTLDGKDHEWQLVPNQKHNEGTSSTILYVGWLVHESRASKPQFKKQLLNNIRGWVSLNSILITRQEWRSSLQGNRAHHFPAPFWFKPVKNSN